MFHANRVKYCLYRSTGRYLDVKINMLNFDKCQKRRDVASDQCPCHISARKDDNNTYVSISMFIIFYILKIDFLFIDGAPCINDVCQDKRDKEADISHST